MSSGRVIQDSDDESNEGSPPPTEHEPLDLSLETIVHLPSSSPPKILGKSGQPSSSSTERLDSELKAAHQSLLEPTPLSYPSTTRSRHSSQQPSDSPKEIRESKRRATVTELVPKTKKRKKDGRATKGSGDFYGHSEDELGDRSVHKTLDQDDLWGEVQSFEPSAEECAAASRVDAMLNSYSGGEISVFGGGGIGNPFSIETSVQKALLPPTPRMGMGVQSQQRSEPSTWPTIPNTTPAKSTPVEELGRNTSSVDDCRSKGSEDNVDNVGQATHESGGSGGSNGTAPVVNHYTDEVNVQDELSLPQPSISARKSSNSTQKPDSGPSIAADELGPDDLNIGLPQEKYQPRPSRSRGNHGDNLIIPEDFSKRPEAISKGKRKIKTRRKTTALEKPSPKVETEDEGEDEIKVPVIAIPKLSPLFEAHKDVDNVGIQQETNKSLKDSIAGKSYEWRGEAQIKTQPAAADPSPEKRGRGRPKKQVVKPIEALRGPDAASQGESDDAEDMTDTTASSKALARQQGRKKLKPNPTILEDEDNESLAGDEDPIVPQGHEKRKAVPTDDEHEADLPDVPELATSLPKKRGRKKRKTDTEAYPIGADRYGDVTDTNQPVEEVPPKQRGRKKKQVVSDEMAPVDYSNDIDHLTGATEPSSKAPPKKRGRKKREPEPPSAPIILSDHEDSDHLTEHEKEGPPEALSQSPNKSNANANATKTPPAPSPQKLTTPPLTPAKKVAKPTHSPITSSKVKFRVGLSKRAQIAPLLRIVRK